MESVGWRCAQVLPARLLGAWPAQRLGLRPPLNAVALPPCRVSAWELDTGEWSGHSLPVPRGCTVRCPRAGESHTDYSQGLRCCTVGESSCVAACLSCPAPFNLPPCSAPVESIGLSTRRGDGQRQGPCACVCRAALPPAPSPQASSQQHHGACHGPPALLAAVPSGTDK